MLFLYQGNCTKNETAWPGLTVLIALLALCFALCLLLRESSYFEGKGKGKGRGRGRGRGGEEEGSEVGPLNVTFELLMQLNKLKANNKLQVIFKKGALTRFFCFVESTCHNLFQGAVFYSMTY